MQFLLYQDLSHTVPDTICFDYRKAHTHAHVNTSYVEQETGLKLDSTRRMVLFQTL